MTDFDSPFTSGADYLRSEPQKPQAQQQKPRAGNRETAWRLFSPEFNGSKLEIKATEDKVPSYIVTPLGAKVNRVLIAGVLTEIEDRGTEEEHMWTCRVQDPAGYFYVNAGRFQPEASAAMASLSAPCYVAAVGKVRMYRRDDGSIAMSVRPERIMQISEETYLEWVLDAAKSTWSRLKNMKRACSIPDATAETLMGMGSSPAEAEGIIYALDNDEPPSSEPYLKAIQSALRKLLPEEGIDFGFPDADDIGPDEVVLDMPGTAQAPSSQEAPSRGKAAAEDAILRLLEELDADGKGAPRDELERRAEDMGISSVELEEITNSLMDKGLVYEPSLRYIKLI